MKKITLFLLFSLLTFSTLIAQINISFSDAQQYDPDRYKEFIGSPYFFSDFTDGWITETDGTEYDKVQMNYNGYTDMFEVLQGDQFINLQETPYMSIQVLDPETKDTVTFIRGVHADFKGKYIELLYKSDQAILVNKFRINITESSVNTMARTDSFKRFKPQDNFYLKLKGQANLILLKNNKKSWIKAFGHKKAIESFIKDNKLDLSEKADIVQLLRHVETL